MNKTLNLVIAFLFLVNCCNKQETGGTRITERYDNGKKKVLCKYSGSGELEKVMERVTFDENGQIIIVENLAEHTAKMIWWGKNGFKKVENQYEKGKKHGHWREWYSSGAIKKEKRYDLDKLLRLTEYKKDKTTESLYKDGKLFMTREYNDGIITLEKTFAEGKLIKAAWFYPDGKISDEREYKDGLLHGKCIYWDRNGETKSQSLYNEGKLMSGPPGAPTTGKK